MAGNQGVSLRRIGWALALGLALLLVVVPLVQLLAVGLEEWRSVGPTLGEVLEDGVLSNTLWLGVIVALAGTACGAAAAFLTERILGPGHAWIRMGILLPFLIPGFVSALSFIRTYGPGGITDDLFGVDLPGLFGPFGIAVVLTVNTAPLAYLLTVAALRSRVEPDLERAARVHGAPVGMTWLTVTGPLLAPALLGAMALVFVSAINAFGAPAFLGTPAGFSTVTTAIYRDLALAARPEAFSRAVLLAVLLVSVALVFIIGADRLLDGIGLSARTGGPAGANPKRPKPSRLALGTTAVAIGLTTVAPLVVLVLTAFTRGVGLAPVPPNLTTANFAEAVQGGFLGAFGRSLLLAIAAASMVMGLGALVAALRAGRLSHSLRTLVLLTFAVPGSTLAVAVLLTFGARLRDTLAIILLAYVAKLWGVGHRVVAGAAETFPPDLYKAARASGATAFSAVRTVVAPSLRPALWGGWLIVFVISFHELTMSSILYGPGTDTLSVVVLNLQQLGDVAVSSAVAVLLTVPVILVALPIMRGGLRTGGRR